MQTESIQEWLITKRIKKRFKQVRKDTEYTNRIVVAVIKVRNWDGKIHLPILCRNISPRERVRDQE